MGGGHLVEQAYQCPCTADFQLKISTTLPNDGGWYLVEVIESWSNAKPDTIVLTSASWGKLAVGTVFSDFEVVDKHFAQAMCFMEAGETVKVYAKEAWSNNNPNDFRLRYVKVSN